MTIEWLRGPDGTPGKTWSPMSGCSGCEVPHCWAPPMVNRLAHNPTMGENQEKYARVVTDECVWCEGRGHVHTGAPEYSEEELKDNAPCPKCNTIGRGPLRWTGEIAYFPERLDQPLHWQTPRRIAVCLMGDMFAEGVDRHYIFLVFSWIKEASHHTFIVLTKRPDRMRDWWREYQEDEVIPNLLTGTSITDQATADKRVPELLKIPGRHCISYEPALGPVDFSKFFWPYGEMEKIMFFRGDENPYIEELYLGGQTGKDAPPMHPDWARRVRDDCKAAGVAFWFKRWSWPAGKPDPGRTLDGEEYDGD